MLEQETQIVRKVLDSLQDAPPMKAGGQVSWPGQRTWRNRQDNERHGIPVDRTLWERIRQAATGMGPG